MEIFPSLICANQLALKEELTWLDPLVQGYHIDIMDFHFVPNLTWGPAMVNALRAATNKPFMVHLMVDFPENYFDHITLQQGDILSLHAESPSKRTLSELFKACHNRGWQAGLALNPETPLSLLKTMSTMPDHLLLMAVNPGFSGQLFIENTYEKLSQALLFRDQNQLIFPIAIDGGITLTNARYLIELGADQLVIGSAIFSAPEPLSALEAFQKLSP